jgi:hypothetical protein
MYRNKPVVSSVNIFREHVIQTIGEDLLKANLTRRDDILTWEATNPYLSKNTAEKLAERQKGADILFIPLAHGGVPAGMDTFLFYRDATETTNSLLYPVRFSLHKLKDRAPRITREEKNLLREKSEGRRVVIFDDDTQNYIGSTISRAMGFFKYEVFKPNHPVTAVVNKMK